MEIKNKKINVAFCAMILSRFRNVTLLSGICVVFLKRMEDWDKKPTSYEHRIPNDNALEYD